MIYEILGEGGEGEEWLRNLEKLWKGREESGLRWDKEVQGNAPETEAEESGRMIGNGCMKSVSLSFSSGC